MNLNNVNNVQIKHSPRTGQHSFYLGCRQQALRSVVFSRCSQISSQSTSWASGTTLGRQGGQTCEAETQTLPSRRIPTCSENHMPARLGTGTRCSAWWLSAWPGQKPQLSGQRPACEKTSKKSKARDALGLEEQPGAKKARAPGMLEE